MKSIIKTGDIHEIHIDALTYGAEGIGRLDGMTVFIPDTVPGDLVKAEITSVKKSFAHARVIEIIKPSEYREKPACGISKVCGGCQWQHINYEEQLRAKKKTVEDSFKKFAHLDIPVKDVIPSEYNAEYRCKVQYPVQQTKVSRRILAGYYKKGTHDIVNIKCCPVQPKIIDTVTQFIRDKAQELGLTAYDEKKKKGLLRHLVYRYSQTENKLVLIIVINDKTISESFKKLCNLIKDSFPEVKGILVNFNTTHTNIILGPKTELICGHDFIEENLEGRNFKISAGSFFQVNPATAIKMFNIVHDIISERISKPSILDVYAGVGSFAIWLKDIASRIVTIEEYPAAVKDAKTNIEINKHIQGAKIEIIEGNADTVLESIFRNNQQFDVVLLDPPRKGCSKTAIESAIKIAKHYIIYVSCNPATLARDASMLNAEGFVPEFAQPVDMFCHTYHIESIVILKKQEK